MPNFPYRKPFSLRGAAQGVLGRLILALATRRNVEGVPVYFDPDCTDVDELAVRIAAGLGLVRQTAPRRWRRVVRDLSKVHCTDLGRPGAHYDPCIAACVMDPAYVRNWPESSLAATVVHEATHARIERAGIAYLPERRARIERRCMLEEISFVEGLPGDQSRLLAHLRSAMDSVWYTDEQLAEYDIVRLRTIGAPPWVLEWAQRRLQRRLQRRNAPASRPGA